MKYDTAPYSTPPRSVLCQYNDYRWDVSHRHSGGSAVPSPRSKWRKHAEMGETELFIITSSASLLSPVNGWSPYLRYDPFLLLMSALHHH